MNNVQLETIDVYVILGALLFALVCNLLAKKAHEHAAAAFRRVGNVLVPLLIFFWLSDQVFEFSREPSVVRTEQTIIGILLLWIVASALKALYLRNAPRDSFRSRTPNLVLGIFSFFFVVVGGLIVFAAVWKKDLSPLLTTFGVGSIVLGLALQDTLGNLFAGLALVFDHPFSVGDWVQVGDVIGRVKEVDWRSVRVVTRELNEITIPNVTLGKERITNFSSPSPLYGMRVTIGFSYDAPPNLVRKMLTEVALGTPGIVAEPYPDIRTSNFNSYSVDYESLVFIADYGPLNRIRNEFMTRVWYAARRYGLTIPYPTQVVYQTKVPLASRDEKAELRALELLRGAELFKSLTEDECRRVVEEGRVEVFGRNENLFNEGDQGDFLFVFLEGEVAVQVTGDQGKPVTLATLGRGDVIGEMALFTGEPRKASAQANTDVKALRIEKPSIAELLESREELINAFVASMSNRLRQADEAKEQYRAALTSIQPSVSVDESALRQRIRRFFGL